jgi:hypothetical protein
MFDASQVAVLLASFAFVWVKFVYMDPRATDWTWYGVQRLPFL